MAELGRRAGLRPQWPQGRESSILSMHTRPHRWIRALAFEADRLSSILSGGSKPRQNRWSVRLPVTEEITGSSPVRGAKVGAEVKCPWKCSREVTLRLRPARRCVWIMRWPCEGWMIGFDSRQWLVSEAEVAEVPGCEPGGSGFESRPTPFTREWRWPPARFQTSPRRVRFLTPVPSGCDGMVDVPG